MKTFADDALPVAVGVGVGILCAMHGFGVVGTLVFVTVFYLLWKLTLWGVRHD